MVKLKEFANVKMPSLCYTCAFLLNAEILHNNFRKCHQWLCVSLAGALSTESLFQRAMPSNLRWMTMQSFIFIWRSELLSLQQVVCFHWATFKGQWNLLGQLMSLLMMCPDMTTLLVGGSQPPLCSQQITPQYCSGATEKELCRTSETDFILNLPSYNIRSITNPMP